MTTETAPTSPALARDTPGEFSEALRVFCGHSSPRLLILAALVTLTARVVVGSWSALDLLVPVVIASLWPLLEWLIHVHLLHFRPRTVLGIRIDPLNARRHREHHLDPWRFERAFIPVPGLLFALAKLLAVAALSPWPVAWTAVLSTVLLGLHYEWVHYLAHVRYCPRSHRYRTLVLNHRRHHFKSEKHWMGVSMLSGDLLMGTAAEPHHVEHSPTVRHLHKGEAA